MDSWHTCALCPAHAQYFEYMHLWCRLPCPRVARVLAFDRVHARARVRPQHPQCQAARSERRLLHRPARPCAHSAGHARASSRVRARGAP
eukprot:6230508-Prymnesium_polylepis.2